MCVYIITVCQMSHVTPIQGKRIVLTSSLNYLRSLVRTSISRTTFY